MDTIKAASTYDQYVWQGIYFNTTEHLTITTSTPYSISGNITGEAKGQPFHVLYNLEVNKEWQVQSVNIKVVSDTTFSLFVKRNNNKWEDENGNELTRFKYCEDIDISLTPFTNTLPINRLKLSIGASKEFNVIYLDLLKGELQLVKQRYTNLGNDFYNYENLSSGFTSNMLVDKKGFVISYPGIWERTCPLTPNQTLTPSKNAFLSALYSNVNAAELAKVPDLYSWLIGSWDVKALDYLPDGEISEMDGEWHFSWVLEGRAIQDIWIAPKKSQRFDSTSKVRNRYGTTIRIYDQEKGFWRINWFNPVSGANDELYARKVGGDIMQEGKDKNGDDIRWIFTDIKADSFRWYGERSSDGEKTWTLEAEFFGSKRY